MNMEQATVLELKEIFPNHRETVLQHVVEKNTRDGDFDNNLLTRCIDELVSILPSSHYEDGKIKSASDEDILSIQAVVKTQLKQVFPDVSETRLSTLIQHQIKVNKISCAANLLQRCIDDLLEQRTADDFFDFFAIPELFTKPAVPSMNGEKLDTSTDVQNNTETTNDSSLFSPNSHGSSLIINPETVKLNQNNNNTFHTSSTTGCFKSDDCTITSPTELVVESHKTNDNKKQDGLKVNDNKTKPASDMYSCIDISDSDSEENNMSSIDDSILDSDDDLPPCNISVKIRERTWSPKARLSSGSKFDHKSRQYISPSKFCSTKSESSSSGCASLKSASYDPVKDVYSASIPVVSNVSLPSTSSGQCKNAVSENNLHLQPLSTDPKTGLTLGMKEIPKSSSINFKLTPSKLDSLGHISSAVPSGSLKNERKVNSLLASVVKPTSDKDNCVSVAEMGIKKSEADQAMIKNSMFTSTSLPVLGKATITTAALTQNSTNAAITPAHIALEKSRIEKSFLDGIKARKENLNKKPASLLCPSSSKTSMPSSVSLPSTTGQVSASTHQSTKSVPIPSSNLSTAASRSVPFSPSSAGISSSQSSSSTIKSTSVPLFSKSPVSSKPNVSLMLPSYTSVSSSFTLPLTVGTVSGSTVQSTQSVPIPSAYLSTTAPRSMPSSAKVISAKSLSPAVVSSQNRCRFAAGNSSVPLLTSSSKPDVPCILKPPTIILGKRGQSTSTTTFPQNKVSLSACQEAVNSAKQSVQSISPILKPPTFTLPNRTTETIIPLKSTVCAVQSLEIPQKLHQNSLTSVQEQRKLLDQTAPAVNALMPNPGPSGIQRFKSPSASLREGHLDAKAHPKPGPSGIQRFKSLASASREGNFDAQTPPKPGPFGIQRDINQSFSPRGGQHDIVKNHPISQNSLPLTATNKEKSNKPPTQKTNNNGGAAIDILPLEVDNLVNEDIVYRGADKVKTGNVIEITDDSSSDSLYGPDVIQDDSFDVDMAEVLARDTSDDVNGVNIYTPIDFTDERLMDYRNVLDIFKQPRHKRHGHNVKKLKRHKSGSHHVESEPLIVIPDHPIQPIRIPDPPVATPVNATTHNVEEQVQNTKTELLALFPDIDPEHVDRLCLYHTGPMALNTICNILLESNYPKKPTPQPTSTVTVSSPAPVMDENVDYFKDYKNVQISDRRRYVQQVNSLLNNDFPWLSVKDIVFVMKKYDNHYAPSYQELSMIMKQAIEFRKKVQATTTIPIRFHSMEFIATVSSGNETKTVRMRLLKNKRPLRSINCFMPELIKETAYVTSKLSELEQEADLEMAKQLNDQEYEEEGQCIECGCCYGEYPFDRMVQCSDGHLFCQDCLKQYAKEAVFGQGKADLRCMTDMCEFSFPKSQLEKALSSEILAKYEDRVQEDNLNLAELGGLVRCPHCDFQALMDDDNKVFTCLKCDKSTCRHCKEDWEEHFGKRCEEIEKKDETKIRLAYEERMTQAKVRTCHRCKAQFTKEDGCNKMTCRCGAKMCYICRKPNIDYNHFCRHPRDPGKVCAACKDCSLWTNPEEDDDRAVREIQKEANEARKEQGYTDDRLIGAPDEPPSKKQKKTWV